MYSLFEEQITQDSQQLDHYLSYGSDSYAEALSYFPEMESYNVGPDEYLSRITRAKQAVGIPIIGSLNGVSTGGWIDFASKIEKAGADALELNVYYIPTDPDMSAADVEEKYMNVVEDVKKSISIPIAVKLGPYFSNTANMAKRLRQRGADALVLFNRFYQPDFDLENLDRHSLRTCGRRHCHFDRRAFIPGCIEGAHGRGAGDDDDVRASEQRRRPYRRCSGRHEALDGSARIRIGATDAGQHEPAVRVGADGFRTCQLHESVALMASGPHRTADIISMALYSVRNLR
jgi:hypothetical protein